MKNNLKTFLIYPLLILIIFLSGCRNEAVVINDPLPTPTPTPVSTPEVKLPEMNIMIMKLGKADSIIIQIEDKAIVIDTGEKGDGSKVKALLKDRKINEVDYMILTHLDKDHIGGASRVLEEIKIKNLIQSANHEKSDEYNEYITTADKYRVTPVHLREVMEFSLNNANVKIIPARNLVYDNDNDYSIMTEITYGEKRFLFAGDAMDERLKEYLSNPVQQFDFLKIPHHGVWCDMMDEFIKKVSPQYSAITCSDKNMPDDLVISALEEVGSEIFLTNNKYIEIKCNGIDIDIDN